MYLFKGNLFKFMETTNSPALLLLEMVENNNRSKNRGMNGNKEQIVFDTLPVLQDESEKTE
jgi:hypothetical protein